MSAIFVFREDARLRARMERIFREWFRSVLVCPSIRLKPNPLWSVRIERPRRHHDCDEKTATPFPCRRGGQHCNQREKYFRHGVEKEIELISIDSGSTSTAMPSIELSRRAWRSIAACIARMRTTSAAATSVRNRQAVVEAPADERFVAMRDELRAGEGTAL